MLLKTHVHMCTHTCIWPNKHHATHNIEKLYVTNKNENDIIILFLPMEMNIKLTLMWLSQLVIITGYYCDLNNQKIQIKNKIKLEEK